MKPHPRLQAAIFDIGEVVIGIAVEKIAEGWAKSAGLDARRVFTLLAGDPEHVRLERGDITIGDYHKHIERILGCKMPFERFEDDFNSLYTGVMPGIEPLLARLQPHLRLVALTNTNASHAARWTAIYADVLKHFERIFTSHEMRTSKPDLECYRHVLRYLAVESDRVVFIDDKPANVEAATRLGMFGIVARSTEQIAAELEAMGVL